MNNKIFIKVFSLLIFLLCSANSAFCETINRSDPGLKFIMTKFGIAMGGVALFSLLLYLGLSLYNKIFVDAKIRDYNLRKDSLRAPADKDEAIMAFITRNRLK